MRFALPAVLLCAALTLAGCGADTPTPTPVVIVVTATPAPQDAPSPTTLPPTAVPSDTPVPATATPDAAATAALFAQATVAAEDLARATAAAQVQATQTEAARPTATPAGPTADEMLYLVNLLQQVDELQQAYDDLHARLAAPDMSSEEWGTAVGQDIGVMLALPARAEALQVPDSAQAVQLTWQTALRHYKQAATTLGDSLVQGSVSGLSKAQEQFAQADSSFRIFNAQLEPYQKTHTP